MIKIIKIQVESELHDILREMKEEWGLVWYSFMHMMLYLDKKAVAKAIMKTPGANVAMAEYYLKNSGKDKIEPIGKLDKGNFTIIRA